MGEHFDALPWLIQASPPRSTKICSDGEDGVWFPGRPLTSICGSGLRGRRPRRRARGRPWRSGRRRRTRATAIPGRSICCRCTWRQVPLWAAPPVSSSPTSCSASSAPPSCLPPEMGSFPRLPSEEAELLLRFPRKVGKQAVSRWGEQVRGTWGAPAWYLGEHTHGTGEADAWYLGIRRRVQGDGRPHFVRYVRGEKRRHSPS